MIIPQPGYTDAQYGLLWTFLGVVFVVPFIVPAVERNLEPFLLCVGALAVTVAEAWSGPLLR